MYPYVINSLAPPLAMQGVQCLGEVLRPLGAPGWPGGPRGRLRALRQRRSDGALRAREHRGLRRLLPAGGGARQVGLIIDQRWPSPW